MSAADHFNLQEFKRTLWARDRGGRYHLFITHRPENHPNQQLVTSCEGHISVMWASGRLYENGPDCNGDLVSVLGGDPTVRLFNSPNIAPPFPGVGQEA